MRKPYLFKTKESITIEAIRNIPLLNTTEINGYEYIQNYFVDSSGFGQEYETALTFNSFIEKIKVGFAYAITEAGHFQVNIGEFKPNKEKVFFEFEELKPIYDRRKSFYNKAMIKKEDGKTILISYETEVCYIERGKPFILNTQSHTTKRHIREFLKQNGFEVGTTKEILEWYGVKK